MCFLAVSSSAHHTDISLDFEQIVEVSGTVKEFHWTSPHSALYVIVTEESGQSAEWALDLESPGSLSRAGWKPTTLVPGDRITVTLHPLKDGAPGGKALTVKLPDGTVMGE
jgi:hypothetical protein